MEGKNKCLKSKQVEICTNNDGVLFSLKPLFGNPTTKLILYKDIKKVEVSSQLWIFASFRLFASNDKGWLVANSVINFNYKLNVIPIPFWKIKKWYSMVGEIKSRVTQ